MTTFQEATLRHFLDGIEIFQNISVRDDLARSVLCYYSDTVYDTTPVV